MKKRHNLGGENTDEKIILICNFKNRVGDLD
jgi:hypothetical protein